MDARSLGVRSQRIIKGAERADPFSPLTHTTFTKMISLAVVAVLLATLLLPLARACNGPNHCE